MCGAIIWSTDWFKDRTGQIERILNLVEQSRQNAKKEFEAEKERREAEKAETENQVRDFLGEVSDSELEGLFNNLENNLENRKYVHPVAVPYEMTNAVPMFGNQYLLDAPITTVAQAILTVVEKESPIHFKELTAHAAVFWSQRPGSSIIARVEQVSYSLEQLKHLEIRGEFVWKKDGGFAVRSRKETNIPAERIAPEEVREAILQVLRADKVLLVKNWLTKSVPFSDSVEPVRHFNRPSIRRSKVFWRKD